MLFIKQCSRSLLFLAVFVVFIANLALAQATDNKEKYNQTLNQAEKLFFEKKYKEAKVAFQDAQKLMPTESHPKTRIGEINKILGIVDPVDGEYKQAIAKADALYKSNKYAEALEAYKTANDLLPDQQYATDRIFELHALIKKNENLEKNYQSAITKGTQYFGDKKYELAITEFETALTLKPGESVPTAKIAEIKKITATIADYQKAIGLADELYSNKEYEKAKAAYLQAQSVKPDEKYPQSMISRIDETTANIAGEEQARQQLFDQTVAAGDGFFRSQEYSEARVSYESALKIKPSESYPKAKINEIENLLANIELQEKQYAQFIVDGDKYFNDQNLKAALVAYRGAEKLKPEETYPKAKVAEITALLTGIEQIEQNYQSAIAKADQEFGAKNYDLAKSTYENASAIKPDESYPKTKIAEIATLLAGIQLTEQNYQSAIAKADNEFGAMNYDLAKSSYENASAIKPDESYPKTKIAEITTLLAGIQQTEQNYQSAIAKADQEFSAKNYDLAKADYQNASTIKPDESYPKTKIAEITTLLAGIQQTEQNYQSAIAKADQEFSAKNYDLAKAEYQNASTIKPEESYPKTKIAEITTLLAGIQQTEQNYQSAIAKADQEFGAKNYDFAKAEYQNASAIKPEESYPKTIIAEITTLLAGIQQTEQSYQSAIAKADQEFSAKNYDLAKSSYENASAIKPEESYPKTKIAEITTLLAGIQQTEQNYQSAITKADQEFSAKDYNLAKASYENASAIKPDESYPKTKIAEITTLLAGIQQTEQNYQSAITKADQEFSAKDYDLAKASYENASTIKPDESYPKTKIAEITTLLAGIQQSEQNYQSAIAKADQEFSAKNYDLAKASYENASAIKPDESYPKTKIAEITTLLAGIQQTEQNYQSAIAKADQEFGAKNYDLAKSSYENASSIKPDESYPKTKIAEITTLLAGIQQTEQNYQSAIAKADQEFGAKNYDLAKSSYENASSIKPDESYPKTKIAEITTLLAGIQQSEQNYQSAIAKADQEFGAKNYDLAKADYQNASAIKPEESYPKTKIAEITTLLAGIQLTEQNYQSAIAKADNEFGAMNYDLAKSSYENASAIKPDESYPKTKIAEITTLLAGIQQTEQNYQSAIAKADQEFSAKNYDLAKADYQNASTIKPDESYPKTKIAEITTLLAGIQQTEQNYQSAIAKADQEFSAKNYDLAKASYENASAIKPDESYPKTKIAEIITLLAGIQQTEQNYQSAIAKADQEFGAKNYDLAKADYQNASAIKPEESYPKTKIAEITTLLAGIQQTEQNYQSAIAKADQEFGVKNYDLAKSSYENASAIKPDESYPKTKIAEITTLLAGIQQTEQNYQSAIAKADQEFSAKNYDLAKADYQNASTIKPDESYPKTKIAEITTLLAGIQQSEQNYQSAIAKADQEFSAKNYDLAKADYQNASTIKPDESYPKTKIAEITTLLAGIQQTEQNYQSAIAKADQEFGTKNYDLAKSSYENASAIKPDESYPKTKIAEITTLLAGIQQTELNYQAAITKADQEFGTKNYDLAKSSYENASAIKPDESYPKTKIAEITTLLAGIQQTEQNYQAAITKADQEFAAKNYDLAKADYQNALTIKPEESYPKTKIAEITTLLAGIQQSEQNYQSAIAKADQEFSAKNYDLAKADYQNASTIKPDESYPKTKIAEITTLLAGIQQTEQNYQSAIAKADQEFGAKNYDLAKASYENASTIKPDESYPKTKIAEIDALKAAEILAYEENRKNYDAFIASGNFQYDADNFHMARNSYNEALKLFPDEPYPKERLKDIEAILQAESERIQKEYNIAISEADRFFAGKVYDNAIEYYMQASGIKPDETYPIDRINAITKLIQENVVVDVLKQNTTIESGSLKQYDFEPVLRQGRKESYVIIKMKNLSDNDFRLFLNYGKGAAKNGGFVINIPKSENLRDYVIRVGGQYKWVSEDNNWISVQPEGGSAEISVIQISQE